MQTGKLYYVNQATGVSSFDDPRKLRLPSQGEAELQTAQLTTLAHEFLCSKRSETLRQETALKASCSSSSGSPHPRDFHLFSTGKQLWNLQLDDRQGSGAGSSSRGVALEEDSNLELDLNLVAGGSATSFPTRRPQEQTVCTMEMIQNALKRTESNSKLIFKRHKKHSISPSFSSLTNSTRSEPSGASPSTSSSSASSTSSLPGASHRHRHRPSTK